ncbi:DUF771 domain-containing protein [Lacticaseibacillus suilingensis]|uniref:DUF771 domain-containing protein n=1 Tax=Lacticaseibacillus suilingensis TaxID=2799577 RepID=UPI0022E3B35A|nr:DUF771 domain-containing protein [Lacticaseibacillus suilingensis]
MPTTLDLMPLIQEAIKAAVDRAVADQLKHEPDYRRWWSAKEVQERYGITPTWLSEHILNQPRFQRQLDGFAFNYHGQMGWRFEPLAFSEFMRKEFRNIAKEAKS